MSRYNYRSSRPDHWTSPRPYSDASLRYHIHGPLVPLEKPSFLRWLLGRG